MTKHFWIGFEKQAQEGALLAAHAAGIAGLGALSGHISHVRKKVIHAREGKKYEEKSFIDKHPKLTGALSLGLAPAISTEMHQRKLDRNNPHVRKVMDEHPFAAAGGEA